jgi:hypothetical protein
MDSLTSGIYCGEITLDANRYRVAYSKALTRATENEDKRAEAMRLHVANVRQAQEVLGRIDMVLTLTKAGQQVDAQAVSIRSSPSKLASGSKTRHSDPDSNFLAVAVGEARTNRHALLTAVGAAGPNKADKLAIMNVVQLHTQGMLKRKNP